MKLNRIVLNGSITLLILFNLFNALNFFFQFVMVRLLSIENYGILAALFSITAIAGIFGESMQLIVTKYVSTEKSDGKIKNIMKKSFKKTFFFAVLFTFVYLISSIFLSSLLNISYLLLALNGIIILLILVVPVPRGIMQGKKWFNSLGINMNLEAVVRLILGICFVVLGWNIYGALGGYIIGISIAFILTFFQIKTIVQSKEEQSDVEGVYGYSIPVLIVIFCITLFYSLDIIIARIVFDEVTSAHYALASVLAKMIFLGTQPISKAMFPISAENKNRKMSKEIIINSILLLLIILSAGLFVFGFFSEFIIKIYSGKEIIESANILFNIGVSMVFLAISNIFLLYKLSLGKTKGFYLLPLAIIIQAIILFNFGSSLQSFSLGFIISSIIMLLMSLLLLRK